jgi:hypothetical protein
VRVRLGKMREFCFCGPDANAVNARRSRLGPVARRRNLASDGIQADQSKRAFIQLYQRGVDHAARRIEKPRVEVPLVTRRR